MNIGLAGLLFFCAADILRFLGQAGAKALFKIMSLLLASIAVMLIRRGVQQFLA